MPNEQVVEVLDLETEDPELRGEMTRATILTQVEGGTHVLVVQEDLPRDRRLALPQRANRDKRIRTVAASSGR